MAFMSLTFDLSGPVTLPITGNYTVDWGDGVLTNSASGTPLAPGPVKITGTVTSFGNGQTTWTGADRLTALTGWENVSGLINLSGAFKEAVNLISVPATLPSTVTNLSYMFQGATNFNGNISGWNTAAVTDMSFMFYGATAFNGNISGWNTAAVTNMTSMFQSATAFNSDLSGWNTAAVSNMSYMFSGATAFNQNISGWNTGAVTDMSYMFQNATNFNGDISGWITGNVTNMSRMFSGATNFNGNISGWNTAGVTNMSDMFYNATNFNSDLSGWNTGNVTDMAGMFNNATNFNQNISGWITGNVTNMSLMFYGATNFNSDLSGWNTGAVTSMSYMFYGATNFNGGISGWITGNVINMSNMFQSATAFNSDLSGWNTGNVTNMSRMFQSATAFNGNISTWNTGSVTNMSDMFNNATNFNSDLSGWNTAAVTNMADMFNNATNFNSDLSGWNTAAVTNMAGMFYNASAQYSNGLLKYNYRNWPLANGIISTQFLFINGVDKTTMDPKSPFYVPVVPGQPMTLTFDLSGPVTLPIAGNYTVDWGNGISVTNNPSGTPLAPGPVKITGTVTSFGNGLLSWTGADRLTALTGWGDVSGLVSLIGAFSGATSLTQVPTTLPSTVTNLSYMFAGATAFNGNISGWNTGNVTNMSGMFYGATAFNSDLSGWNTGAVTDMKFMFNNATNFNSDLSGWITGAVTDMSYMFYNASAQYSNGLLKYNYRNWPLANGIFSTQFLFIDGVDTTTTDPKSPFYLAAMTLTFNGSGPVTLPIAGNYTVDWGNGISVTNDPSGTPFGQVKITGTVTSFGNGQTTWPGADRLTALTGWGDVSGLLSLSGAFSGATSLTQVPTTLPSTVTNLSYMFSGATNFNGGISGWNTAAVTNMAGMFESATAFNSDLSGWITGDVTDMSYMFYNASAQYSNGLLKYNYRNWPLANGIISNQFLYIGGVETTTTDPKSPFYLAAMTLTFDLSGPVTLPIAGNYTVDWGNGISVYNKPTGTPLGQVKITGTVTRFGNGSTTWPGADRLTALTGWGDVSGLLSLSGAFNGASSLTQVPTTLPSTVTNLSYMFAGASAFNGNISTWNTGSVTNMLYMFAAAMAFNQNISGWNTGAVTEMSYMFNSATNFNSDISGWNTGAVTNMTYMFAGATNFNGGISGWNTAAVTNMSVMFGGATAFNQNISGWNTGAVTTMANMFYGASAFNQNISGWNTGAVTTMANMFYGASAFNQNLSGWNTGAVTNMANMFADATAFTADLSGWAYKLGPISEENSLNFFNQFTGGMSGFTDPTTQSPRSPFYTGIPTPSNPYVPAAPLVVFDTPPNPTIKVGTEVFGTVGSVLYHLNPSYTRIAELSTGTFVGTLYRPYIANVSISDKIYGAHTGGKLFSYDTVTRTLDLSAGSYQGIPTGYMALDTNGNLYSTDSSGYIYKLVYASSTFLVLNTEQLPPILGPISIVNNVTLYGCDSENRILQMTIPGVDGNVISTPPLVPPPAPTSLIVDSSGKPYYYDMSGHGLWTLYPLTKLHDFSGNPLDGTGPIGPIRIDPTKRVLYGICSTGGRGLGVGLRGAGTLFSFDLSSSAYSVLVNYVAGDVNRGENPIDFSITTETGTAYVTTRSSSTNIQPRIAPRVANGYAVGSAELPGATTTCFNHGTKILSLMNDIEAWIPVESLNIGDLVMTYLHGPRPITHIFKGVMINNPDVWHTCMYKGQMKGFEPLIVTGGHGLLVDYLTEEEQIKQEQFWGREEVIIDDKVVMVAPVSAEFTRITDRDVYKYYHFVVENDGDDDRRYGVYANGFLTETPSKNQAILLKFKKYTG